MSFRHANASDTTLLCPCTEYNFEDNLITCKRCNADLKDLRSHDERRAESPYGAWNDFDTLEQEADLT